MIAPRRSADIRDAATPRSPVADYDAGGQIAALQSEIERRMRADLRLPVVDTGAHDTEAFVRRLSVAGGYVALGAGYALAVGAWFFLA